MILVVEAYHVGNKEFMRMRVCKKQLARKRKWIEEKMDLKKIDLKIERSVKEIDKEVLK